MTTLEQERCHACGATLRATRQSRAWRVAVGRCTSCRSVSVLGARQVVTEDLAEVARTEETDWDVYRQSMHLTEDVRLDVLAEIRRRIRDSREAPTLFDVGAGTGSFLDMARGRGFDIKGNDISATAIAYAAEHFGIELSDQDLSAQAPASVDALTMWCVLAHVGSPRDFLAAARDMLRPGGVLFLRTPRLSGVDIASEATARATRGRWAKVADQRVTRGHLHLLSDTGMTHLLSGLGFEDIEVIPVVHSGCTGREIAARLGGPAGVQRLSSRAIDGAMSSGIAPRNTMFVYARRGGPAT